MGQEPLEDLLRRTEAALRAQIAALRAPVRNHTMQAAREGLAGQLEDRAKQCASWIFSIKHGCFLNESEVRSSCAEFLRMCGESK